MLRKIATLAAAFATIAMSGTALADDGWWDDDDEDYRDSRYDRDYGRDSYGHDSIDDDGYVYADVIDVEPVYRFVRIRQPQRECWDQDVYHQPRRRYQGTAASTVTGGLIGGAIGRQFGDGKGRDAMTLVGTLIGSAMAHDNAERRNYRDHYRDRGHYRTVERCSTRYITREERRVEGYHVTYAFAGREYTTRTMREPGDQIRVRVAVTPAEYERY